MLHSVWCNGSTEDEKAIRIGYQDKRILISCHDHPYIYMHYAGLVETLSLVGAPGSRFKMTRYEGPVADCKTKHRLKFRCLEPCQKPQRGSVECRGSRGNRELKLVYPKCVLRYCKINTRKVKSQEKAVPCSSRRMLGCRKGFLPEESEDRTCTASGWEPKLRCYHTDRVRFYSLC